MITSNIFISLAAVFLTIETQMQLGMKPQWHPYLFIIFFATLFDYNLHRFITVLTNKDALDEEKHRWVKKYPNRFYLLVAFSVIGFAIAIIFAKKEVLYTLAPMALITSFYSLPLFKNRRVSFRLREIPFAKIFLISFVWSAVTILLPIIQSEDSYDRGHVGLMLLERFLFVFAITIPFDIRDMVSDGIDRLKTIPLTIGEKKSILLATILLVVFILISVFHYAQSQQFYILFAFVISGLSTLFAINSRKLQGHSYYHYGILDGTMILQGLLVYISYYLQAFL